jgi:hypothetical protein
MIRPGLLAWQWSDYAAKHRSHANLLLHIVAVPLFQVGGVLLVYAALTAAAGLAAIAGIGMGLALVLQGRGHRTEHEPPAPFAGPVDFVARFVVEQWVTFPRFVVSGGWYRNLRRAS